MKKAFAFFLASVVVLAIGLWLWDWWRPQSPPRPADVSHRLDQLKARIPKREQELDALVRAYRPGVKRRLDDLDISAVDILRGLPGVAEVNGNDVKRPTARVVHFLDIHTIPYRDFVAEAKDRDPVPEETMHLLFQEDLVKVELFQLEPFAALKCLAMHHGLEAVWAEALTPDNIGQFNQWMAQLKKAADSKAASEGHPGALPDQWRDRVIEKCALIRLVQSGLPAEEAELVAKFGARLDLKLSRERDKAIARRLVAHGKFSLIVLGGGHDLSPHLPAGVEYLRVAVQGHGQLSRGLALE